MDVVWLTSYPKSGNTWVRFLFTNLVHGQFERSETIFEVTPVLERGVDPKFLRDDRMNLIKTHRLFSPDLEFMEQATGVVYIARDPFDVMLSNLNYFFLRTGITIDRDGAALQNIAESYMMNYLNHGGDTSWIGANYGTWDQHAESWVHNSANLPVKVVRYEDLKSDTAGVMREICTFLQFDATDDQLRQAVARSSFDSMREIEEREIRERVPGLFYVPGRDDQRGDTGVRFMNQGKAGLAREQVAEELRQRYENTFAPMIQEFGYA